MPYIFECVGETAVKHWSCTAAEKTVCGKQMYNKAPDKDGSLIKPGWAVEHELPKEVTCKECFDG